MLFLLFSNERKMKRREKKKKKKVRSFVIPNFNDLKCIASLILVWIFTFTKICYVNQTTDKSAAHHSMMYRIPYLNISRLYNYVLESYHENKKLFLFFFFAKSMNSVFIIFQHVRIYIFCCWIIHCKHLSIISHYICSH